MSPELALLIVTAGPMIFGAVAGGLVGYWLRDRRKDEPLDLGFVQISGQITAAHRGPEGQTFVDAIELDTVDYVPPKLRSIDGER